jgi:hypothetical protein
MKSAIESGKNPSYDKMRPDDGRRHGDRGVNMSLFSWVVKNVLRRIKRR